MLVTFTVDDGINAPGWDAIQQIADFGQHNPNGCKIGWTWFMSFDTDPPCDMVPYISDRHIELAAHSMNHGAFNAIDNIANCRARLSKCGNIPESDIIGYRPPYMMPAAYTYDALAALKFKYFSSNLDSYGDAGNVPGKNIWPYTMDNGIVGSCLTHCKLNMSYPGMWSHPMHPVTDAAGNIIAVMDPPYTGQDLENAYMENFLRHYNGNRAPFGIYIHAKYLLDDPSRIQTLNNIIQKMLSYKDTWFVSVSDVIKYVQNPVPAGTQSVQFFTCPGGTPPPEPDHIQGASADQALPSLLVALGVIGLAMVGRL